MRLSTMSLLRRLWSSRQPPARVLPLRLRLAVRVDTPRWGPLLLRRKGPLPW